MGLLGWLKLRYAEFARAFGGLIGRGVTICPPIYLQFYRLCDEPYFDADLMRTRYKKIPLWFSLANDGTKLDNLLKTKILIECLKREINGTRPIKISVEILDVIPSNTVDTFFELPIGSKEVALKKIAQLSQSALLKTEAIQ